MLYFDHAIRVLVVLTACTVLLMAYFTALTLNTIGQLTEDNKRLNTLTLHNSGILIDCTTPAGKCYQRSQADTRRAVVNLNTITKAATVCADRPGAITYSEMEQCITAELAKNK